MKTLLLRILLVGSALLLGNVALHAADDLDAVKSRMAARLDRIDALKASGAVGENNRGLLEARSGGSDVAAIVSAENSDRTAVYAALAKQTGSSADTVAKARARQIAANSAAGVWLQRDDGSWYRK